MTTTALTAERNARELFGGDTVVLRFGLFIGPDSGSAQAALEAAHGGASIAAGPPGAYRPTCGSTTRRRPSPRRVRVPAGTYNVADADPPTNAEIDAALATAAGGRGPAHAARRRTARSRARSASPAGGCARRAAGRRACAPAPRRWARIAGMTVAERFAGRGRGCCRLAYSELGDLGEAEDVVQEAWLRLERMDADPIENLDGWLTTVVARLALDACAPPARAARPTSARGCRSRSCPSDPADRVTLDESVSYALLTVLEQLSPAERTAFVLHDVFDVPFGEVAEVVGRTPEAVRQLASRARRHVDRERPRFTASRDEHERAVGRSRRRSARATSRAWSRSSTRTWSGRPTAAGARSPRASRCAARARVARAWVGAQPQGLRDRIEIELNGRLGLLRRRAPTAIRGALVRRQRRPHHADRRGPQPGEAAPPLSITGAGPRRA